MRPRPARTASRLGWDVLVGRAYARRMQCIFCGSTAKLTREHVFPQWLREVFPDLGEADYLRRLVTFSRDESHQRPGRTFDVVVRDVCEECNNGWMSALEEQARPILTPMLRDEPRTLTAPEQHVVATWPTKTMLTIQGANIGGERVASPEQYRWFYENQTPLSVSYAWLCRPVARGAACGELHSRRRLDTPSSVANVCTTIRPMVIAP